MEICLPTENFINKFTDDLRKRFKFLRRCFYGKSLCSRPLTALYIGKKENAAFLCGGIHGSEYLTVLTMLKLAEDICLSIENKTALAGFHMWRFLSKHGVCIVPCVNPDGTQTAICGSSAAKQYKSLIESISENTSSWQANARGVDLNHNFNAGWSQLKQLELENGICAPAKTRYGGEYAESEPESRLLAELFGKGGFSKAFAFHSQGREIYCSYGKNTPQRSFEIAEALARSSGYTVCEPEGLAIGGGFKDWVIEKMHKPALTVEIGIGKNPLPLSDFKAEYDKILEMLCLCCIL